MKKYKLGVTKKKMVICIILIIILALIFVYFTDYKSSEKGLLYFKINIDKSNYEAPYFFESNKTIVKIEKNRIICEGVLNSKKYDPNDMDPEEYGWKEEDYFSVNLSYDPRFHKRRLEPTEVEGSGYFEPLEIIVEESYILSDYTNEIYTYKLNEKNRVSSKNHIHLEPMITFFKGKHPEHKIFPIRYCIHFSLETTPLAPISDGNDISLHAYTNAHIQGIEVSENFLIKEIQPDSPDKSSQYVYYQTEYKDFHIVISELPSIIEKFFHSYWYYIIGVVGTIIGIIKFYHSSLKKVDLEFDFEPKAADIEKDEEQNEVPYVLHFCIDIHVSNNGNSPGSIRRIQMQFLPSHTFKKFISKNRTFKSQEYIKISPKEREDKSYSVHVSLANIEREIDSALNTNVKSETLLSALENIKIKRIENIKKLLKFLQENKYLGELEVTYEYTYSGFLKTRPAKFKKEIKRFRIEHSYKTLLDKYEFWIHNFDFIPPKRNIIEETIRDLEILKGIYAGKYLNEYQRYRDGNTETPEFKIWPEKYTFTLLHKCRKYKNMMKTIKKPQEMAKRFLEHQERYGEIYQKYSYEDLKKARLEILKDFVKETQKAIKEIESLTSLLYDELKTLIGNE